METERKVFLMNAHNTVDTRNLEQDGFVDEVILRIKNDMVEQLKKTPAFRGVASFLSNFAPYEKEEYFLFDGIKYPTNEHYYQAQKFDYELRQKVADHPSKGLKKFCRTLGEIRKGWDEVKVDVMVLGLNYKFRLLRYKNLLLLTGDEELVERNYWKDTFWGVCDGKGENILGRILMEIRTKIKNNGKHENFR